MTYLVDTNIVSEFKKREPSARVVHWLSARRVRLVDWLQHDLPNFFAGRILPIDAGVADRWGRLVATAGRPLPAIDSLLAATGLRAASPPGNTRSFANAQTAQPVAISRTW